MTRSSVESIVASLEAAGVRYLIAGGLAVVAHGHVRFTADVDLVLAPDEDNLRQAVAVLESHGYVPRAPVPLSAFADRAERTRWQREKGMVVFSTHSARHPATEVDLFLEPPIDFESAWRSSVRLELTPGVTARFVSLADLRAMKRASAQLDRPDGPRSARAASPRGRIVTDPRTERMWEQGWDGHAAAQARRMAALTLAEKLAWLEEAHALVLQLHAQQDRSRAPGDRRDPARGEAPGPAGA